MLPETNSEKLCLHHVYCHKFKYLKKANYLSCIVVNDKATTYTLKVLVCPHCIIQFLQNQKQRVQNIHV